jgi:hypothetical protein
MGEQNARRLERAERHPLKIRAMDRALTVHRIGVVSQIGIQLAQVRSLLEGQNATRTRPGH